MILALDTSTAQAGVALMREGEVRAEQSWNAAGNHSSLLTLAIGQVLTLEGVTPGALSAIVVACGPGSYSGVRVGVSEAKGLAMALGVPLVGISTLDAAALQASCLAGMTLSTLPAGRGRVYAARYTGGWQDLRRIGDYVLLSVEEAAQAADRALVVGEAAPEIARWAESRGMEVACDPGAFRLRRAGFLAELGKRYLDAGGTDQRDSVEPLYLRKSSAEEKRDMAAE